MLGNQYFHYQKNMSKMRFSIVLAHLLKVAKFQPIVDKVQNLGSVFFLDVFLDTEGRPQVKHLFLR